MKKKALLIPAVCIITAIFSYIIYTNVINPSLNYETDIDGKDISKEEYIYKEDLLELGYKIDEIKKIETKLSSTNVKKYLLSKKYENITKYLECNFFNIENIERYVNYQKKNKDLEIDKIIMTIETNLDYAFYTNIKEIENPNEKTTLINKYYKLPENYTPTDLVKLPKAYSNLELELRKEAADAVIKMFDAAKKDGINLNVISAYRTKARQTELFNNSVKKNGKNHALMYSAKPRHSEHELGLAIDINTTKETFKNTKEYAWLKENAYKYGFIERYPKTKENITGFGYEPWHYRYLGINIATKIFIENITYEEYVVKYLK